MNAPYPTHLSPQQRAERVAARMLERDRAAADLGLSLNHTAPGAASISLTVETRHLNGHDICHGGVIFTLADTAFAIACNSYNQVVVAQHNTISFVTPAQLGEVLTAVASETAKEGRNGIYDVQVTTETGRVIAHFRGCSRVIQGVHFEENKG